MANTTFVRGGAHSASVEEIWGEKTLYEGQFKRQLKLAEQSFDGDETLKFKFYEQFPQAKLHARAYEDEIAKLIGNLAMNEDVVVVAYCDL